MAISIKLVTMSALVGALTTCRSEIKVKTITRTKKPAVATPSKIEPKERLGAFTITDPQSPVGASPTISWSVSATAMSYRLSISTDPGCATVIAQVSGLSTTSHTLSGMVGGQFYACVMALDLAGNVTNASNNGMSLAILPIALGQPDIATDRNALLGLNGPHHVSSDGTRLFAADYQNHRILIWNTLPTTTQKAPDVVLGQANLTSTIQNNGGLSAKSISGPKGVYSDGTHLFVADFDNNRVLIWNSIPTVHQTPADVVLGQPNMMSNTKNNGGITAKSLNGPRGMYVSGGKFYLVDEYNNRILIWNAIPSVNQQAADVVLGQADMVSGAINAGVPINAQSLWFPVQVSGDGSRLFIADTLNCRALIWNSLPTVNRQAADVVLGQPDMTTGTCNNGGTSSQSLWMPTAITTDGTRLMVADYSANRVLIWNTIPTVNRTQADLVLGQPDMAGNAINIGGVSGQSLYSPERVFAVGTRLFVGDNSNRRILIWNTFPTSNQQAADLVLGQPDFISNKANNFATTAQTLSFPIGTTSDGPRFYAIDQQNNRALIWSNTPTSNEQAADLVLGQPNMRVGDANSGGVSAVTLNLPTSINAHGGKLFIADEYNNRVLIWNSPPATTQQPANVVLGQPNMASNALNNGGLSARSLYFPYSAFYDGTRLFVADMYNHRVLIWNALPTVDNQPADVVLGQPDMTTATANNGGTTAISLYQPRWAHSDGTRLFIADQANNRVLIWNTIPTVNRQPADVVLGQPNMTSGATNNGGISAQSMNMPSSLFSTGDRLYVADESNNRVLVWNTIPTVNQQAADMVIGQPSMTTVTENLSGMSATAFNRPFAPYVDGPRLYISDLANDRILVLPSSN